jgi:uncharacterized protein YndB with AHSA1/START domain
VAVTAHQYRIYIKSPIQEVWNALLDPDFTRRYFHGTSFDAPPASGEPYRTSMPDGSPAIDGVVEVLEPPHRLVMTWHVLYDAAMEAEAPGRVEWTLAEAGEGLTQVDLRHGDLAMSPLTWAHTRMGWVWILDGIKTLLETGDTLPAPAAPEADVVDDPSAEWHRAQGVECNNSVWALVGEPASPERDEELLRRVYASAYHWQRAARRQPVNEQRALYMQAKVHLLVGNAAESLRYAERCMALTRELGLDDFDLAYAHEAMARGLHAVGRTDEAMVEWAAAKATPVVDADDREIVEADLAEGP